MSVMARCRDRLASTAIVGTAGSRLSLAAAARGDSSAVSGALAQKLVPALFAAEVVRLSVAHGVECRRLVHCHFADGIGLHAVFR